MPLAALVARSAPPARAVVVPAAENTATVRTVVSASALKSVGKVEGVVVVAGTPMPSKFCVYTVDVDRDMAAKTTATDIKASTGMEVVMIKRRDLETDADIDLNIDVPLVDEGEALEESGAISGGRVRAHGGSWETANHPNVCVNGWI